MKDVNTKFIIRGLLLALPTALVVGAIGLTVIISRTPIGRPPDPTPPPPTILAPRGEPPPGPVGLQALVQYRDQPYVLAGSGFFISLSSGDIVGVMAAHSVSFDDPNSPPERVALRVAGQPDFIAEFDTLWGEPGRPGEGFVADYVLLSLPESVNPAFVLTPDPRGKPQPGERVSLFSGQGDGQGGQRILEATVQSVSDRGMWMLMDQRFDPGMMSGSPVLSQHTGQVVGMVLAVTPRRNRLLMGASPIGSIVRRAESASEFPKMSEFLRSDD